MASRYTLARLDLPSLSSLFARISADRKPKRLATTALPTDGSEWFALTTNTTPNRLVYFDGTVWRYSSDDAAV